MANLKPTEWRQRLGRLREDLANTVDQWLPERVRREEDTASPAWSEAFMTPGGPKVDVEETDNEIRVTAELPGMDKEDFSAEITGNRLMLRGEKKSSREEQREGAYYYAECSYGSFVRTIPLPCEVNSDEAEGEYKNGVLKLRLPKTEQAKAKRVNVTVS
ncbi:MAG: Hsp20/alpha crystallin family protein [Candidatus Hydrogenedentota bacterium]